MDLIAKIPALDDAALKNLLDNARRLAGSGQGRQQSDATDLLPHLEAAFAERRASRLEAAAEKRAAMRKPSSPKVRAARRASA